MGYEQFPKAILVLWKHFIQICLHDHDSGGDDKHDDGLFYLVWLAGQRPDGFI